MKKKLKELIERHISEWMIPDIYVISLYVENIEDDPLKPTVRLGYNTESQYQKSSSIAGSSEARWNFAYWLQNSEFVYGEGDTSLDVEQWMKERGFLDLEESEIDEVVTIAFIGELVELVQELHEEKILMQKYGKELPIIIHELEYYPEIAEQNIEANGEYLPESFIKFCC